MKMKKKKVSIKTILLCYLLLYMLVSVVFSSLTTQEPIGEYDEYTLVTASFLNDGNFSVTQEDIEYAKLIFPELNNAYKSYIKLSGYIANNGGELSYYAPTYSLVCVPVVQILLWLGLPAIFGFAYTNILCVCVLVLVVILSEKINDIKKILLVLFLTINPVVFYFTWHSAEAFMYAMLGLAIFAWLNGYYKVGGIFVSLVGSLNPTAMVVGIFMIIDYFLRLYFENENDSFKKRITNIVSKWKDILLFASTFFVALVPFGYAMYYSGSISLPASEGTMYSEAPFEYFLAYLFDLNFGFLPYFSIMVILFFSIMIGAVIKKERRCFLISSSFLCTVFAYSFMRHINCGMSGIARYNVWSSTILIFVVIYYYDRVFVLKKVKYICIGMQIMSACFLAGIIALYGPMRASNTTHVTMTPIARTVLDNYPQLYNPLKIAFNSRVRRIEGEAPYTTPVIYEDEDGNIRKVLLKESDCENFVTGIVGQQEDIEWLEEKISKIEREQYISIPKRYSLQWYAEYQLGDEIYFASAKENADAYVKKGLSGNEGTHVWTNGKEFEMAFLVRDAEKFDYFHACFDVLWVFNQRQNVNIYINGEKIKKEVCVGGNLEFDFELQGSKAVTIKFEFPNAISPLELTGSYDSRVLALALTKATIEGKLYQEELNVNEMVWFHSEDYNASKYVKKGLSWEEATHSWTDGNEFQMEYKVQTTDAISKLHACFETKWIFSNRQHVIIYVNDICVFDDIVTGGNIEFDFDTPSDGIVNIRMELPDAVSPLELGQSQDARKLALALKTFQITPAE